MVELNIVNDNHVRKVLEKLRRFVKECTVILVTLHHEQIAGSDVPAGTEIARNAANQKRRVNTCLP